MTSTLFSSFTVRSTLNKCVDNHSNCVNWTSYCSYHSWVQANCKKALDGLVLDSVRYEICCHKK
ncbi:hypothetical protein pdam_00002536 [Pocillopora damicornis]|uniref:ShKT domain-containing protein n=1 Tax=Pocillopora damicornis TaxID=46731 RepID=A0A3M6TRX0_POCDA|nr:hypothetical protein pdam_00002536 [Pocillopora damicornis]